MAICWGLFGLFVLVGVGGYVGNSYAWSRVFELHETVIPTLPRDQQSAPESKQTVSDGKQSDEEQHAVVMQWQTYESPADVPEDVRKWSFWMNLIVPFDRLKWIGAIGAGLMMLIILFLRYRVST